MRSSLSASSLTVRPDLRPCAATRPSAAAGSPSTRAAALLGAATAWRHGIAQLIELANQFRGRCGARQVRGARLGITVNTGGIIEGDAAFVGIHAVAGG